MTHNPSAAWSELASSPIKLMTSLPGPKAREQIAATLPYLSPSLIFCYPLMVKRAAGCMVEDVDGNVLLDVMAGVATASTGHCHPKVVAAIAAQAETLIHICGTDFHYPGYGALARKLGQLAPGGGAWQVFLSNSGTEAVEASIKLARYHTGRQQLIAFRGGFHGRTLGSLALTASKPKYRKGFGPVVPGSHHGTFGDIDSIEKDLFQYTVSPKEVAAIVVEPILGEGGYIVPKREFLVRLREICDQHGILLVFDEVQTGMGRTGKMFAAEHFGVYPDIYVLAKGLASGMPLGAVLARKDVMTWTAGTHGSTYGGNPVAIASALATIELLETELCANSEKVGTFLKAALTESLAKVAGVLEVRGVGLMIGVEFDTPKRSAAVAQLCYERGLLVLECGTKAIRLSPPLVITREQAEAAAKVFAGACKDAPG